MSLLRRTSTTGILLGRIPGDIVARRLAAFRAQRMSDVTRTCTAFAPGSHHTPASLVEHSLPWKRYERIRNDVAFESDNAQGGGRDNGCGNNSIYFSRFMLTQYAVKRQAGTQRVLWETISKDKARRWRHRFRYQYLSCPRESQVVIVSRIRSRVSLLFIWAQEHPWIDRICPKKRFRKSFDDDVYWDVKLKPLLLLDNDECHIKDSCIDRDRHSSSLRNYYLQCLPYALETRETPADIPLWKCACDWELLL